MAALRSIRSDDAAARSLAERLYRDYSSEEMPGLVDFLISQLTASENNRPPPTTARPGEPTSERAALLATESTDSADLSAENSAIVFLQRLPGRSGEITGPVCDGPRRTELENEAIAAAHAWLIGRDVAFVQANLPSETHPSRVPLEAAGYRRMAEFLYLVAPAAVFPQEEPPLRLSLVPYREEEHAALLPQIVRETYVDSRDCPAIGDGRSLDDVLAGYRGSGKSGADRWRLVRSEKDWVGCLLLADDPGLRQYELVYFGLVPSARGKSHGLDLVRHALWLARQAGRERLVLAVDADNLPALLVYHRTGFVAWNQRVVWGRSLERESLDVSSAAIPSLEGPAGA